MREVFNSCVGEVVLVKTWKKHQLDHHQARNLCFKEVMLAESCCHTNITELLDVFNGDVPRLVYSWKATSMLLHHAVALGRTQSFVHSQKAAVMADILQGLAFLHSRGVVHQGLAPVAVVLLFSAQKAPVQAQILDLAGSAVIGIVSEAASGLSEYRAPEVHLGTTAVHPSQDIWAIGAIMALLATGVQLFETGMTYREDMQSIIRMLGNPSDLDCAALISLRLWSADFCVAMPPLHWKARMDEGCGPGAGSVMEQMFFFSSARSFRKHNEKNLDTPWLGNPPCLLSKTRLAWQNGPNRCPAALGRPPSHPLPPACHHPQFHIITPHTGRGYVLGVAIGRCGWTAWIVNVLRLGCWLIFGSAHWNGLCCPPYEAIVCDRMLARQVL
jgi:serine/threonine protein kinase